MKSPKNNNAPDSDEEKVGVRVNIAVPQKWLAASLGFCLSFGFGYAAASSQSQDQVQKQSQSQTQVTNCNTRQANPATPLR